MKGIYLLAFLFHPINGEEAQALILYKQPEHEQPPQTNTKWFECPSTGAIIIGAGVVSVAAPIVLPGLTGLSIPGNVFTQT